MAETTTTTPTTSAPSWARPWRATETRRAWAQAAGSLDPGALDRLAAEEAAPPPVHDPMSYAGRCEHALRQAAVETARRVHPWTWPLVRDAEAAQAVWLRAFEREVAAGRALAMGEQTLPMLAHCRAETVDALGAFAPGYYEAREGD